MKNGMAIVGLAMGVVGLIVALAVRQRWARPVGAVLIAIAVVAEIAAVQAHGGGAAADGGGAKLTPIATATTPSSLPTAQPTSSPTGTFVISPRLLSQVHPGIEPITKVGTLNKEFVRLTNNGTKSYSLGGWRLSNGRITFVFPPVTLAPHSSLVVKTGSGTNTTGSPGSNTTTILHWNLTSYVWPHQGGTIYLRNPQGKVINVCQYAVAKGQTSASC
jgi:hypothetical protein